MNTQLIKPDFNAMTGKPLVDIYNEMVSTWTDLGGDNSFGSTTRFASAEAGRKRCEKLHAAIQAKVAANVTEEKPVTEVRVNLINEEGLTVASGITIEAAAERMGVQGGMLLKELAANGTYSVSEPEVLTATPAGAEVEKAQADVNETLVDKSETLAQSGEENAAPAATTTGEAGTAAPGNESEDEMARKAKKAKAKKTGGKPRATGGVTIKDLTEEYNSIVKGMTKAQKEAAPFAKHHTSMFESKEKAEKQLARLKKAIK